MERTYLPVLLLLGFVVFNAALYGKDVAATAKPTSDFWTAPKPPVRP